ncbi:mitochondrial ribosomal protein S2 [Xylocopa sonorina]|uniref:mitochondrial ribosomal protein S2 n=1 Tax=Xylocopa sonorina TaxID=1818115 RepID=UPI00403ABB93
MTSIINRSFSSKLWRDWNILRPFLTYLPKQKLSTTTEPQQEIAPVTENQEEIDPLSHPDFFNVYNMFSVKDLFEARVHFGHKEGSFNPHMKPYIFGSRLGYLIIDLDQTAELLRQALNFTAHIASQDGIILFIAKNPQISYLVERTAKECQEYAHTRQWKMGTFTNTTNEFGAVTRLPDLCILLNTMESVVKQHTAVTHAAKMLIPTVGIVDTNCDPRLITYPVPGNDDTPSSIELYCKLFKEAIMRGKQYRDEMLAKENKA